eukprot:CAMPEP_0202905600 /NCGR_PEP_ID=MMETSP1392-20130828/35148_1 /ASSEMBLY_ACC=CAM_ASM_000868 /TAXON_ID=225041 /ORGANISM="Chlamydomonas chlamydogama, Strain SAG 11-48b" /LENGTH=75 /DNA_ID=CAMNT_0049593775 /DNA_START=44 /DNA_END=271 /DNA_ORIENTATION=+
MSGTVDYRLITRPELLDVVDEEWAGDALPDDLIPLPERVGVTEDAEDMGEEAPPHAKDKKPEKWNDLAIGHVVQH